jgi:hypothetical protein
LPQPLAIPGRAAANITKDERHVGPPEHLIDHIVSHDLIHDAVITPSGHTFDRKVIERCIDEYGTCPVTRAPLEKSELRLNRAIQEQITAWKANAQVRENHAD